MVKASISRDQSKRINLILSAVRRHGAKIYPLARRHKIKPWLVYREAKQRGIRLRSGYRKRIPTPMEIAESLNRRFGPGASQKFRRLRFAKSFAEIGKAFGRSHQWASDVDRVLFRGAPKPNPQRIHLEEWAANGFLMCLEILASHGVHEQEAAKLFGASQAFIHRLNENYRLGIETGAMRRRQQYAALRECVLTLRRKGFSISRISGILRRGKSSIHNFERARADAPLSTPSPPKAKRAA